MIKYQLRDRHVKWMYFYMRLAIQLRDKPDSNYIWMALFASYYETCAI
jgi:hypothetical protein